MRDKSQVFSRWIPALQAVDAGSKMPCQPKTGTQAPGRRVAHSSIGNAAIRAEDEGCRHRGNAVVMSNRSLGVHHGGKRQLALLQMTGDRTRVIRLIGNGQRGDVIGDGTDALVHHLANATPARPKMQQQWLICSLQACAQRDPWSLRLFAGEVRRKPINQRAALPKADQHHSQRNEGDIFQDAADSLAGRTAGCGCSDCGGPSSVRAKG